MVTTICPNITHTMSHRLLYTLYLLLDMLDIHCNMVIVYICHSPCTKLQTNCTTISFLHIWNYMQCVTNFSQQQHILVWPGWTRYCMLYMITWPHVVHDHITACHTWSHDRILYAVTWSPSSYSYSPHPHYIINDILQTC